MTPFCVVRDQEKKKVVISIRGSMSLKVYTYFAIYVEETIYGRRQKKVNVSFVKTKPERRTILFRLSLQFVPKRFRSSLL